MCAESIRVAWDKFHSWAVVNTAMNLCALEKLGENLDHLSDFFGSTDCTALHDEVIKRIGRDTEENHGSPDRDFYPRSPKCEVTFGMKHTHYVVQSETVFLTFVFVNFCVECTQRPGERSRMRFNRYECNNTMGAGPLLITIIRTDS